MYKWNCVDSVNKFKNCQTHELAAGATDVLHFFHPVYLNLGQFAFSALRTTKCQISNVTFDCQFVVAHLFCFVVRRSSQTGSVNNVFVRIDTDPA